MPKGKTTFTKRELESIRTLLQQKSNALSSVQKSIRKRLRSEIGFYITDFGNQLKSVEDFDRLVENGEIKCSDSSVSGVTNRFSLVSEMNDTQSPRVDNLRSCRKSGLAPVIAKGARILILGTLPGDESLKKQEYYSNPGNRFWKIIYSLFGEDNVPGNYNDRIEFLKEHGIALWDMLCRGIRKGSLDQDITREETNDIHGLIELFPTIKVIAFNGKKAHEIFMRYYPKELSDKEVKLITLYSSSGANNKYSDRQMLEDWRNMLK